MPSFKNVSSVTRTDSYIIRKRQGNIVNNSALHKD